MSRPKGFKMSPEHKVKISLAMKGNKNQFGKRWKWSEKSKKKIKGRKIKNSHRWKKGQIAWNKGKKMPETTRQNR